MGATGVRHQRMVVTQFYNSPVFFFHSDRIPITTAPLSIKGANSIPHGDLRIVGTIEKLGLKVQLI